MPLSPGKYLGTDSNRRVYKFTMMLHEREIPFLASYELVDDIAKQRGVKESDRDQLFEKIRPSLEQIADRKFFSYNDDQRPAELLLTTR